MLKACAPRKLAADTVLAVASDSENDEHLLADTLVTENELLEEDDAERGEEEETGDVDPEDDVAAERFDVIMAASPGFVAAALLLIVAAFAAQRMCPAHATSPLLHQLLVS